MANIDLNTVRQLTEKFFNATLSDQESERLSGYARDLTSENPIFKVTDMQLLNDLELIKMLNSHSEASLENLAMQTPDELSDKLNHHISELARSSRKRLIFKRIIPMTAAAAVVAIFATIGFKATEGVTIENPETSQFALSAPKQPTVQDQQEFKESSTPDNPVFIEINKPIHNGSHTATTRSTAMQPSIPPQAVKAITAVTAATSTEKIKLPSFSDPMIDVMPMIAAATIDPSNVVIQPLSTLSQTVCNVYESVDAVSSSFAGISETLDLVSSSLAILSLNDNEIQ